MRNALHYKPFFVVLSLLISFLLIASVASAQGGEPCDITWAVDADGFWDEADNWDLGRVPQYNEHVCMDRPIGEYTVTVRQNQNSMASVTSAETLRLIDGAVLGSLETSTLGNGLLLEGGYLDGEWQVSGGSTWSGSELRGTLINLGTLTIDGGDKAPYRATLTNLGTMIHASGHITASSGTDFFNQAGATWEMQDGFAYSIARFDNAGTLRKSGSGAAAFGSNTYLNNLGGTIDIQGGSLMWRRGASTGGVFIVDENALLDLTGGNVSGTFEGMYTGSGAGRIEIASGRFNTTGNGVTFDFPTGLLHWTGGRLSLTSARPLTNTGTLQISGDGQKELGGTFINSGQVIHSDGGEVRNVSTGGGSVFNNLPGARYHFTGTGIQNATTFTNQGTVRKSGAGEAQFTGKFNNAADGIIDVQAGQLTLNGGGRGDGGTFSVAENAVLEWRDWWGKHTGVFTGSGGGKVQITGDWEAREEGATLDFPAGMLEWVAGTIGGGTCGGAGCSGDTTNAGFLTLVGDADKTLIRAIINTGTIVHSGEGNLTLSSYQQGIVVQPGGLYEFRGDGAVLGNGAITNQGTVRKSDGAETSVGAYFFNQGGIIDVQSGTLNLAGHGEHSGGVFNVEAGTVLEFSRDVVSNAVIGMTGIYTGTGAGTVRHRGYIRGDDDDPPTLNFPEGMFHWTGGFIYGGTLINQGYMHLNGDEDKFFRARIVNRGTIVHTGDGNLRHRIDAVFENEGLYDLQSDAGVLQWEDQFNGSAPFYNRGTFRKSDGVGVSEFDETINPRNRTVFSNTGTVEVLVGSLSIAREDVPVQNGVLTGGVWHVGDLGQLILGDNTISENAADVTLTGDAIFTNLTSLLHNRGHLRLADGHEWTISSTLTNSGVLTVGVQSLLKADGFAQASTGQLGIEIGGRPDTRGYGRIEVDGEAQFDGTLAVALVEGFGPSAGDVYEIVRYAGRSGTFAADLGVAPDFTLDVGNLATVLTAGTTANDLVVETITVPATGQPGDTVDVSYRVRNRGSEPIVGSWTDSLYLSFDTVYDAGDVLLGRLEQVRTVDPGAVYEATLRAPLPGVIDRDYYVIAIADSRSQVADANRNNNTAASTDTISVTVPVLPYDTPVEVSITEGEDRYYRLDVSGEQYVVVSATFDTELHAELFARHGEFPTRADYDHVAAGLYDLQREMTLPKYIGGAYYLYLHGREGAGDGRPVTLHAREVPLALHRVTPDQLGNSGQATLRLEGLNFAAAMDVALVQGETTIQASSLRVENEQTAYVTFDLQGVAAGLYAVRLHNEAEVTLPGVVAIAAGNEADVWFRLIGPGRIRPGRAFEFTLEYGNRGGADAPAPWITVGVNDGLTWRVKNGHAINGLHFDLLAISPDGPPSVLRPGQRHQITFQATSGSVSPFIQAWIAHEIQRLDAETIVRRFGGDPETAPWDAIAGALDAQLGTTHTGYRAALRQLAADAAAVNNREYSVDALLQRAVADLLLEQSVVFARPRSDVSDVCEGRSYDTRFNGKGSRLPDGRWVPFPSPRQPTPQEMIVYNGAVDLQKDTVAVAFGLRQEWLEWIELWKEGTGEPWVGTFDSRTAQEMLTHLMTPQKFDVVQIDELAIWDDINNRIAFQDVPFGDVPFGEAAFEFETKRKDLVSFSNYIFPKPGEVKWAFGGNYLHYPMTPGGNWTTARVETKRDSLNPAGDIVHWTVRNMPMRVIDEFNIDEHVVNKQARSSGGDKAYKGDPVWFYVPFYMLQTFGDARCMKWIVNLVLPEHSGKAILAGVEADAGGDRTIKLRKNQTHVNVTLHGSAETVKTRLATESDGVEAYDWGGFPVTPPDEQNPTVHLSKGTYVFTLNVNGFGTRAPYADKAYTDFDSVTVRVVEECRTGDPECTPPDELRIGFVTSWDPNDIVGPAGVGDARFVTGAETFPYTILFENKAEATAPAQEVFITHPLSSDLDWSTFALGSFGFGERTFDVPAGRSYHQARLDLVDELGFYLDFEAGIDLQTGMATWTFRTLDPKTGDLIGDALAGFLPPNQNAPEGEGFVNFTVQPKASLSTGAQVDAQASIIFDINAPIDTPVYRNTIDVDAPASRVDPLLAESASPFTVSWTGDDDGSGVAAYDVYVSSNGGDWTLWQRGVTTTQAIFTGEVDINYAFYSVATDGLGYLEEKTPTAETSTTVTAPVHRELYLPSVMHGGAFPTSIPAEQSGRLYLPSLRR